MSVDSPYAHKVWADREGYTFPLLSDFWPHGEVARAYGVLGASGLASRWTFLIGADGRIFDVDKKVNASSHGRDIVAKLEHR